MPEAEDFLNLVKDWWSVKNNQNFHLYKGDSNLVIAISLSINNLYILFMSIYVKKSFQFNMLNSKPIKWFDNKVTIAKKFTFFKKKLKMIEKVYDSL